MAENLAPPDPKLAATQAAEIFSGEPEPIEWLVEDILPRGRLSQIVADSYDGKSRILEHIACCVATGAPVFNRYPVPRPGNVLISSPEDFIDAHRIYRMHAQTLGYDLEEIAERLWLYEDHKQVNLDQEKWCETIVSDVLTKDIDLVIIDPLQDHTHQNHNYQNEIGPIYDWLRNLARQTDTLVFLSDHVNRRNEPERVSHRQAGSQAGKKGKVDISWLLNPAKGNPSDAILTYDKMKGLCLKDRDYLSRVVRQDELYRIVAMPLEERREEESRFEDELRVLETLDGAESFLNVRDLRETAGIDNRRIPTTVEALREKGFVGLREGDKNAKLHYLTEKGEKFLRNGVRG